MTYEAVLFVSWLFYAENRFWFDWWTNHVVMILEAWVRSVEKKMIASIDNQN